MILDKKKLPAGIWALGFVSLLMDTSSEMVHGLLPVFLVTTLGASVSLVGLLEGFAEAAVLVAKVFSGPLSDWAGKRKPFVALGYAMGTLSKPFFALANSIPLFFGARLFDRIGKGIRGAPRDALVADLAPPELRGQAFGLRQSLDTVGAFLGPIVAIALMYFTANNYRKVFWFATVPGVLSVVVLLLFVREKARPNAKISKRIHFADIKNFPRAFWFVVIAGFIFQLARFSEAFLILRAKDFGLGLAFAPMVLIMMNVVYALSSYPIGYLSDRIQREWFLLAGLFILLIADLVLGFGTSLNSIFIGIALWGLHLGLTQGTLAALIADTCPPDRRGTAYGVFNLFSAVALLFASVTAGILWDKVGPQFTFVAGAAFSSVSLALFSTTKRLWSKTAISTGGDGLKS